MAALVSIGGFDFPEPSTYNATTSTIVDSARTVQGRVVGAVVRHDVAKIELSWKYFTISKKVTGESKRTRLKLYYFMQAL